MTWARRSCLCVLAGTLTLSLFGRAEAKRRPVSRPAHKAAPHPSTGDHSRGQRDAALPVILIDPGHGGTDPGAISPSGTMEKTVTLATGLRLARALTATGRYRVVLTRHDDRFVPLATRAAEGLASGAALIISLHADSSSDHRARGASVYVRRAGQSSQLTHVGAGTSPGAIASALTPPAPGSDWLQSAMINSLDDDLLMTATPARTARLRVLASHGLPGVLVEMGFLSNPHDEKLLRNPQHQQLITRCLKDAVDDYFRSLQHGPARHT